MGVFLAVCMRVCGKYDGLRWTKFAHLAGGSLSLYVVYHIKIYIQYSNNNLTIMKATQNTSLFFSPLLPGCSLPPTS